MKRLTRHLAAIAPAAALLLIASACGQGKSAENAADSDSASVAEASPETFTSPDLTWKDLKGNVESVATTYIPAEDPANSSSDSIRFNPEGRISAFYAFYMLDGKRHQSEGAEFSYSADGNNLPAKSTGESEQMHKIARDEQGRIISYAKVHPQMIESDGNYEETYTWDEEGRIHSTEINGWEVQASTVNEYGADGELVKSVTTSSEPGYQSTATSTYTYTKRDDRGNWTERTVTDTVEADEEGQKTTYTTKRTERRSIRYRS